MKGLLRKTLRRLGFDVVRLNRNQDPDLDSIADLTEAEKQIVVSVKPFTMTSVARIAALLNTVNYLTQRGVPGDIAECGVWHGGSMMAVALALLAQNDTSRSLFLYDTFEGMSPPGDHDRRFDGVSADSLRERAGPWCFAGLEDVRRNVLSTGYPKEKVHFVKGKVENTIPDIVPEHLSLLRLDTDWYESTRHELVHLYPRLDREGILIVDDYGHWQGVQKAVDEYFRDRNEYGYLHRIDYTARLLVKNGVSSMATERARK